MRSRRRHVCENYDGEGEVRGGGIDREREGKRSKDEKGGVAVVVVVVVK
jgi:hypothetical protein